MPRGAQLSAMLRGPLEAHEPTAAPARQNDHDHDYDHDRALDPETQVVVRARGGDTGAQHELFVRYAPQVAALLRRTLGRTCDVEDAVQQAFVIALEKLPSLHDPGAFRAWLFRIAIRSARRMFWTIRLRELAWPGDAESLWIEADLAAGVSADERARLVLLGRRLATLPVALRLAWIVRYHFDCTLPETAAICGCALATLKRRLAEAEARLETHGGPT